MLSACLSMDGRASSRVARKTSGVPPTPSGGRSPVVGRKHKIRVAAKYCLRSLASFPCSRTLQWSSSFASLFLGDDTFAR